MTSFIGKFLVVAAVCSSFCLSGQAKSSTDTTIVAEQVDGPARRDVRVEFTAGTAESIRILGFTSKELDRIQAASLVGDLIHVRTKLSSTSETPSLFGRFEIKNGAVIFYPQFPLQKGMPYFVELAPDLFGKPAVVVAYSFTIPQEELIPITKVEAVFPSASVLPANLLKFYIHFSTPMSAGDVYSHIKLLDSQGNSLDLPFLELGEALWDRESRRLTLLFDPGRIKRGLKPNLEDGAILEEGKSYTLIIHKTLLDSFGRPMVNDFSKPFKVGAADLVSPNPYTWKVSSPPPGTSEAVSVTFPEPLDEALLQRLVTVVDSQGEPVDGTVTISEYETMWSLTPDQSWHADNYSFQILTILEDLAGNSIARPFEVDSSRPPEGLPDTKYVYLPVVIE